MRGNDHHLILINGFTAKSGVKLEPVNQVVKRHDDRTFSIFPQLVSTFFEMAPIKGSRWKKNDIKAASPTKNGR